MKKQEDDIWSSKNLYKCADMKMPVAVTDSELKMDEMDEPDSKLHELRSKIEPWLTALFQSEHLSLLTGAGLSSAVHILAMGKPGAGMAGMPISVLKSQIKQKAKESAEKAGRGESNIEDEIRVINELIKGLEILVTKVVDNADLEDVEIEKLKSKLEALKSDRENGINQFAEAVLSSESNIVKSEKFEASEYLMSFLLSFASRNATRERLNLFTTNYDRIIEFGSELAGLHLIDRFVGTVSPIFRSSRLNIDMHYNPPGVRGEPRYLEGVVNFTKLHGSLDWIEEDGVVRRFALPYGVDDIKLYSQDKGSLMIYPNSSKDRETAEYPYVELFRDMASAVIRPNSTVVTYGYSFGDDHINRVLNDMLTIPSTHLVIIAYNDTGERIRRFYKKVRRSTQITLLIGTHFGNLSDLVDWYLPKPAIDKTTYRMVDLLKARGIPSPEKKQDNPKDKANLNPEEQE